MTRAIRIATRASELALRQARLVAEALGARGLASELVTFRTTGDARLDRPLSAIGAKGLFTRELEEALLDERVDCCVHSLKDLPTRSPDRLDVAAVLPREDPRDALVLARGSSAASLDAVPHAARVGTSSLRRRAQLRLARPDLDVVDLRGNVPTRVRKVDEGQVDAAVLAAAGLHRLELRDRIAAYLDAPAWLPAPAQGAIAIQVRSDDTRMCGLAAALNDAPTWLAVRAERALLAALEGGCQVPIGALTVAHDGSITLHALIADVDGRRLVRGERAVDRDSPEEAGRSLAEELRASGGAEILESLRAVSEIPAPQPE